MLYHTIIIHFKSYKLRIKLGYDRKKIIFNFLQTPKNSYMSIILYV